MQERRQRHEDFIKERRRAQRRAHPRTAASLPVELSVGNELYFHVSADISEGGLFLARAPGHPEGTPVRLTFQLPGEPAAITVQGEVAAAAGNGRGLGVRFLDLDEGVRERIRAFAHSTQPRPA